MKSVCVALCSVLLSFSLFGAVPELHGATGFEPLDDRGAFIVRSVDGKTVCNDATPVEAVRINSRRNTERRVFGQGSGRIRTEAGGGLDIVLVGTSQLDANPQAKAAFQRAAEFWESKIADPIKVYVEVDYGTTRFGEPFEEDVIASASSHILFSNDASAYSEVRGFLNGRGHNSNEIAVYSALPGTSLPTDIGSKVGVSSASMLFRAIGALDAEATPEENGPSIGFNSVFPYDFDPSNGISPGQTDFEGVVIHEIGHMLGFVSTVGYEELGTSIPPTIFDWFRFRPGVTLGTFASAQRVQSSGGSQVYFTGTGTLNLSTGRPDGAGGDENQASHWKDDAITGVRIGVMDPTLSKGVRTELNDADLQAFGMMGYNVVSSGGPSVPAAPSNLTATGTSATVIRLNWTDNSNNETEFRIEQKVNGNFLDIGSAAANSTQINVTGFGAGVSATFRVRARNAAGNSAYSNEASGTTNSNPGTCTPNDTTVCLLNSRFRVKIDYVNPFSNPPNQPGTFRAARLLQGVQNPDTALFGFSSAQAVEVVVRIQDTRPFAPRFDIYYGGMTDVGYVVTVTDTQTGVTRQYTNTAGKVGGGVDRSTFPASALGLPDQLTSGGYDSFPAEMEPAQPSDLRGIIESRSILRSGSKTAARMVMVAPTAAASELEQGLAVNTGGGGGCAEVETNNTTATANALPLGTPCTGAANFSDSYSYVIEYDGGDEGRVHDVFAVTTGATGSFTATLTFTNASADLDIVLFQDTGSGLTILKNAAGTTTTETFTVESLPAGTYYVGVSAFAGSSAYTLTTNGLSGGSAPGAPSNLTAAGTSTTVIRLQWTDNSSNETEFRVEQKVGASFTDIGAASANATSTNVTGFQPSTTATFRVRARNGSGDSPYSNEATGTTQGTGPTVCSPSSTVVCLLSNRFRVKIDYVNPFSNPPNQPGTFLTQRLSSTPGINPDVALFGFSSAQAVEVVVRIQDTRPFAPRFDVYYGGMTDVGYTVTVTDTQTGTTRTYNNTAGTVGGGVDRSSFPAN